MKAKRPTGLTRAEATEFLRPTLDALGINEDDEFNSLLAKQSADCSAATDACTF